MRLHPVYTFASEATLRQQLRSHPLLQKSDLLDRLTRLFADQELVTEKTIMGTTLIFTLNLVKEKFINRNDFERIKGELFRLITQVGDETVK